MLSYLDTKTFLNDVILQIFQVVITCKPHIATYYMEVRGKSLL